MGIEVFFFVFFFGIEVYKDRTLKKAPSLTSGSIQSSDGDEYISNPYNLSYGI